MNKVSYIVVGGKKVKIAYWSLSAPNRYVIEFEKGEFKPLSDGKIDICGEFYYTFQMCDGGELSGIGVNYKYVPPVKIPAGRAFGMKFGCAGYTEPRHTFDVKATIKYTSNDQK